MYIYDFLTSLELLQKEYLPKLDQFPKNAVYYGYNSKDELNEREISYQDENEQYLVYSKGNNPSKLYAIGIDQELQYIQQLNDEKLKIPRASMIYMDTAIYEAIRLYDELTRYLGDTAFFDIQFQYSIQLIACLFQDNHFEYRPALAYFHNNPIERDIAQAQFVYFVKKYSHHRFKNPKAKATYLYHNFDSVLRNTLCHYDIKDRGYKISEYTHIENQEFDNFLQQIITFPKNLQKTEID